MEKIITQLGSEIADKFRLGHEATANKLLVDFIDQIHQLPIQDNEEHQVLSQLVEVMCHAQQRRDVLFLADIIQYELLPLITKLVAETSREENTEAINIAETASTDEALISNQFNEAYFYSANRNSFASKNSDTIFTNHYQKKLEQEDYFYIITGTDSGLLINYIDQHFPKGSIFLFIELPEYLDYCQKIIEQTNNNNHMRVVSSEAWHNSAVDLKLDSYIYLRKFEFVKSLAANDLFNNHYHTLNLKIESEFQEHIFRLSAALGGFEFNQQQFLNLAENIYPVENLKGSQKGKTCIILAGGPSLDESIDWVIENRNKLLVIAVSRISKRLLQANLTPDIIVSVDPKHNSFEVSREMLRFSNQPLFVHTTNVNSGLLSQWQGKSAFIGDILPWKSKLNTTTFEGEGPTVTNTAISLAVLLQVDSILLLGVDLCYSKAGNSHASGSVETEVTGANLAFIGEKAQTYTGEVVQTTIQMAIAARIINHQAKIAKEQGITTFNLSPNANKVEHIDYKAIRSISLPTLQQTFQQSLSYISLNVSIEKRKKHIKTVLHEVSSMIIESEKVKSLALKALTHNEETFNDKLSLEAQHQHKLKMDKIEKQLDKKLQPTAQFIKKYGLQFFIKCLQTKHVDDWNEETVKKTGELYYQAYLSSSELILKELNKTKQRLLSRQLELDPTANIDDIIQQLSADKQPGRIRIVHQFQTQQLRDFSKEEQEKIQQQEKLFNDLLEHNTRFSVNLAKKSPLEGIKPKISLLFSQRDLNELEQLTSGLEKLSKKNDGAMPLFHLSKAYSLVLKEQYEQALNAFEAVGPDNLKEDELTQIARIALALKMPELAESALSMLINFNDIFIPKYAQLLKALGKIQQAIDLYLDYLNKTPYDLNAWLALGNIFIEIKANESAVMAFKEVISRDPTNKIALKMLAELTN